MRRVLLLLTLIGLSGCTLTTRPQKDVATPHVITATLGISLDSINTLSAASPTFQPVIVSSETPDTVRTVEAMAAHTLDALAVVPPTATALPTATPTAGPTLTPSQTPPPTAIPPTRTRPGPPTVLPMDDGSGNVVPGTGSTSQGASPVAGIDALPETLYYLSDQGSLQQVWRLPVGYTYPVQVTFSASGVRAFDVSSTGSLAYLTTAGEMITDGIPFLPPSGPGGVYPQVTALAWSPAGDWLAYTLQTPGAAETLSGLHAVDGLWLRSISQGTTIPLAMNSYGVAPRLYTGPLDWRPDGSEVLVTTMLETGVTASSRVNISSTAVAPLWDAANLLPGAYTEARWNVPGNAIIASGAGAILRIEPDTLNVEILVGTGANLNPIRAAQLASGALTFVGGGTDHQLYLASTAPANPQPVAASPVTPGKLEFLWDELGQQVILVAYEPAETSLGTAYLVDNAGTLYNLTPLTGLMGSPAWGPLFRSGDRARVRTTDGDTLNVRNAPAGNVLTSLPNGSTITIAGGPRLADGLRWWRVQTADGLLGWAAEAILDDRGVPFHTLVAAN